MRNVDRVKKRFVEEAGGGASSGGFGVETVVSTFSFWFVDVLVSWVPIWNHDPDRVFGEPDSFDPFRYEYVYRQGIATVTSQVPVAGVLDISRRDIGASRLDFGNDDHLRPDAAWGILAPWAARLARLFKIGDKQRRKAGKEEVRPKPQDPSMAPEEGGLVIGHLDDLRNLPEGERSLLDQLPDQGNERNNWQQNSTVLRQDDEQEIPNSGRHLGRKWYANRKTARIFPPSGTELTQKPRLEV